MKYLITFTLLNFVFFSSVFAETSAPNETLVQLQNVERAVWRIHRLDRPVGATAFSIGGNLFVTNFHIIYDLLGLSLKDMFQDTGLEGRNSNPQIVLSQEHNPQFLKIKKVLIVSALHDLALIEVEGDVTGHLNLGENPSEPSEKLFSVAYPGGVLTKIRKTEDIFYEDDQVYAFLVNHSNLTGSSGSPILDGQNQVVGVTSFNIHNMQTMVKIDYLKELIAGDTGTHCSEFESGMGFANTRACIKEELRKLRNLVEEEYVYAQYNLALLYKLEKGGGEAFLYFTAAAEYGYLPAVYEMALTLYSWYHRGEVPYEGLDNAFRTMEQAARDHYIPAQSQIGAMYYATEEKEDIQKAFYWARIAAERGFSPAQHLLGVIYHEVYENGVGQEYLDKAIHWMQKSAEQGYELAKSYYNENFQ